jgi:hypothetical protein
MVPVETSSEYLANERILLPEDAVCVFSSFFLLKSYMVLFLFFIVKSVIIFTIFFLISKQRSL